MNNGPFRFGAERSLGAELRPPAGWEAIGAAISTYSLDLTALHAVLLALSGYSRTEEGASILATQRAIMRLARSVVVLSQRGRTTAPRTTGRARVLTALDRCLAQQAFDERNRSWHAKLVLAGYRETGRDGQASLWRLWIGSRNLTGSLDLDAGILFVGRKREGAAKSTGLIPGLGSMLEAVLGPASARIPMAMFPRRPTAKRASAGALAGAQAGASTRAEDFAKLCATMESDVTWEAPAGVECRSVAASFGKGWKQAIAPPEASTSARSVVLAAPFVDRRGLEALGDWHRQFKRDSLILVSSDIELSGLPEKSTSGMELLALRHKPEFGPQIAWPGADDEALGTEDEPQDEGHAGRGLHAKVLLSRSAKGKAILVLGSANLTRRGLCSSASGTSNMEVAVRLAVSPTISQGLEAAIRSLADPYQAPPVLSAEEREQAEIDKRLEAARKAILGGFEARLRIVADGLEIEATKPLYIATGFSLEVALQSRANLPRPWPQGASTLPLAENVLQEELTELVLFRLTETESGTSVSWALALPLDSLKGEDWREIRDAALAARLLKFGDLQALIAAELAAGSDDSGRTWHGAGAGQRAQAETDEHDQVNLEALLRLRARRPEAWNASLVTQIAAVLKALAAEPSLSGERRTQLDEFGALWLLIADAFSPLERARSERARSEGARL